jgi:hypothetical protein
MIMINYVGRRSPIYTQLGRFGISEELISKEI